jgi:hypothetical protein
MKEPGNFPPATPLAFPSPVQSSTGKVLPMSLHTGYLCLRSIQADETYIEETLNKSKFIIPAKAEIQKKQAPGCPLSRA